MSDCYAMTEFQYDTYRKKRDRGDSIEITYYTKTEAASNNAKDDTREGNSGVHRSPENSRKHSAGAGEGNMSGEKVQMTSRPSGGSQIRTDEVDRDDKNTEISKQVNDLSNPPADSDEHADSQGTSDSTIPVLDDGCEVEKQQKSEETNGRIMGACDPQESEDGKAEVNGQVALTDITLSLALNTPHGIEREGSDTDEGRRSETPQQSGHTSTRTSQTSHQSKPDVRDDKSLNVGTNERIASEINRKSVNDEHKSSLQNSEINLNLHGTEPDNVGAEDGRQCNEKQPEHTDISGERSELPASWDNETDGVVDSDIIAQRSESASDFEKEPVDEKHTEIKPGCSQCLTYEKLLAENERRPEQMDVSARYSEKDLSEIQSHRARIIQLEGEVKQLSNRLAEEWSQKISTDESHLENINIVNRPLNIATEYELVCSNDWLNAKNELDDLVSQEEDRKRQFLCDIMLMAEEYLHQLFADVMNAIMGCILQPVEHCMLPRNTGSGATFINQGATPQVFVEEETDQEDHQSAPTEDKDSGRGSEHRPMPKVLETTIGDLMRKNADFISVQSCSTVVANSIWKKYPNFIDKHYEELPQIKSYIDNCAKVAWKMSIQRPPMTFTTPGIGEAWDKKTQAVAYCSDDPEDPRSCVKLYQYPGLLHGDKWLVKGNVITRRNDSI